MSLAASAKPCALRSVATTRAPSSASSPAVACRCLTRRFTTTTRPVISTNCFITRSLCSFREQPRRAAARQRPRPVRLGVRRPHGANDPTGRPVCGLDRHDHLVRRRAAAHPFRRNRCETIASISSLPSDRTRSPVHVALAIAEGQEGALLRVSSTPWHGARARSALGRATLADRDGWSNRQSPEASLWERSSLRVRRPQASRGRQTKTAGRAAAASSSTISVYSSRARS